MADEKEKVSSALKEIKYPGFSRDIVSFGIVKDVEIHSDCVKVHLGFTTSNDDVIEQIKNAVSKKMSALTDKKIILEVRRMQEKTVKEEADVYADRLPIPNVKYVLAIGSGKGGVGKTTVAVNLAVSLAKRNASVGLLDADIYGPNVSIMLGINDYDPTVKEGTKLMPYNKYGINVMSIGFFISLDSPVIWRGPMVHRMLMQFLRNVEWGNLDFLVVDLPPGTGDAQLTLVQKVPISGAIIVTTPQDVSLVDARKGLKMFESVNVPVLGIVENMSYLQCPHCGRRIDVFRAGGGKRTAMELGVPLLAEIPIDPNMSVISDAGIPVVESDSGSLHSKLFFSLADQVMKKIGYIQ
ncbi:MAG: Mrp/NBP35 family ATP-binding protein [Acidobacteriota bacterium]